MRKTLVLLLTAALLTGSLSGCNRTEPDNTENITQSETTEPVQYAAPDFTVYDAKGNAVKLSDFIGKPIVLNFWATWCGPCVQELPHFQEKYNKLGEQVQFLMVNLTDGTRETVTGVGEFLQSEGYTFPVFYDTATNAASIYRISSIPTTYFIDKEGYLVAGATGALSQEQLQQGIHMILP